MNLEIIKVCKNYKVIMECEFLDDDVFSKKLVVYYNSYISSVDFANPDHKKKLVSLDEALYKYVEDYNFAKNLRDTLDISLIISDNFNYLNEFIDYILSFFTGYIDNKEKVVIQTKWL